jgi:hypothetical protein
MDVNRQIQTNERSATSAAPAAQTVCSTQPMGCGKGLDSLDLANVAVVTGTAAVRAAKGEDWTRAFKTGGPDEYQLYQQAKRRHEVEDDERTAAKVRLQARQAELEAHGGSSKSH